MRLRVQSDRLSTLGRAAHDVGVALLLGGNVFGRSAMRPALGKLSDPADRQRVESEAWGRSAALGVVSVGAIVSGWAGARSSETRARYLTGRERTLARVKDAAVASVALTGIATAFEGIRLGDSGSPRRFDLIRAAQLASTAALIVTNTAIAQIPYRRPPLRRVVFRRY
jgi:hypothetical protein